MRIVIVGNFGLHRKATMSSRALPIALELARQGHRLTVLMPSEAAPARTACSSDSVRQVSVGPQPAIPLFGHFWLGLRIAWAALRLRPHALYAFKPIGYAGLTLLLFWALRRCGLVEAVLALDADDWEGEGGWADHEPHPWWQRRLMIWQERWGLRHAEVVTVASRELGRLAAAEHDRTVYVPNAASPSSPGWVPGDGRPLRQSLGLTDTPLVLSYTRFVEFHPGRLVDVFAAVRSRVPSAHLLVVGQGLHGEEAVLARLVHERGLSGAVHHAGWVPPDGLPAYLAAGDVAVYLLDDTLLNRTKCPMKLVDLLLAGVPVVADEVGQASEYVAGAQTGYLVRAGDVDAMADQVAALLQDSSARRQIGQAARQSVLTRWNWANQAEKIARALASAGSARSRRTDPPAWR